VQVSGCRVVIRATAGGIPLPLPINPYNASMLKRVLSPALVAFLLFGCGGNAESDSCQEGRQFYQKLKKAAQTGDRDGDGTVDIVEQEMLPALSEELKDFQTGWYEVGGCALDG